MLDKVEAVPGVGEEELQFAAISLITTTPATDLEDADRFCVAVRALVETRAEADWSGESDDDVAVFVHVQYPRSVGEKLGAQPISNPTATSEPLLGRICFLNRDASNGRIMSLPVEPDAIPDWLEDNGFVGVPVVMVYRGTRKIINLRAGIKGDSALDTLRNQKTATTTEQINEALTHLHQVYLQTPSVCPNGVWENRRAEQYIPGPQPEKAIQRQLQTVFSAWFHGVVKVEVEDSIPVGRIDIRLLRMSAQQKLEYWVIVELKVIKSFANATKRTKASVVTPQTNVEGVCEGIRQACAFAKDRCANAMLEIFDLRKDKTSDVLKEKKVLNQLDKCEPKPICHVWPLFGSAHDARLATLT